MSMRVAALSRIVLPALVIGSLFAGGPARADGEVYSNQGLFTVLTHPNIANTRRSLTGLNNVWAMTYAAQIRNQTPRFVELDYLTTLTDGTFKWLRESVVKEGDDGIPNMDVAAPVAIGQGGRIPTGGDTPGLTNNLYVLWMEKDSAQPNQSTLECALVNDGTQEFEQLGGGVKTPVVHAIHGGFRQGAASFGASPLPDGSGFIAVAVKPDLTSATVMYCTWDSSVDTWSLDTVFETDIPLPSGLPASYNGNIVCAVTPNLDSMSQWYPYRLTVALSSCEAGGHVYVRDYRLNNKISPDLYDRHFLTPVPKDDAWHTVGGALGNSTRDDGNSATNLFYTVDGRLQVCVPEPNPNPTYTTAMTLYTRTGFDRTTQQAIWQAPGEGEALSQYFPEIPAFLDRPIFTDQTTSGDDLIFPVARDIFTRAYYDPDHAIHGNETSSALQARRRPLEPATSEAARVLGIVDGPPPIPNENFSLVEDLPKPWEEVKSHVNFNWDQTSQQSTATDYKAAVSVGLTQSAGVSVGVFTGSLEASENLEWSHGNTVAQQTGQTLQTFADFSSTTMTGDHGQTIVAPLGALYCDFQEFSGYVYDFVDPDGQLLPGSQVFYQVWPSQSNVKILNYWMNPNGHQPGVLNSYLAGPDELDALASRSKIQFEDPNDSNGIDFLSFQYNYSHISGTSWRSFQTNTTTVSSGTKIGAALKLSAELDFKVVKAGASVEVGGNSEVTNTREIAASSGVGLTSECSVFTSLGGVGTYYFEYYETYLLSDDNHYLQELLSDDPDGIGLVTPVWPPIGSRMRAENEAVKAQLLRTSTPWKVTYVIPDGSPPEMVEGVDGPAGPGAPRLNPALARKLRKLGVNTTSQADILIQKREQMRPPTSPLLSNVAPRQRVLEAARATARLHAAIGRAFPQRPVFDRAVAGLTNADVAAIKAYEAACTKWRIRQYRAAHPVRYPVQTPESIMRRPPIVNKLTHYTELPPPGL